MARYPGELCQALRISSKNVLNNSLKPVSRCKITNGLMVELMCFAACQKLPMKIVLRWLELLCGKHWPKNPPAELSLMKALSDLRQKDHHLTLRRNEQDLLQLWNSHFEFPTSRTVKPKNSRKLKRSRRRSIYYEQKSQIYHKVANELSKELYSRGGLPSSPCISAWREGSENVYKNCA